MGHGPKCIGRVEEVDGEGREGDEETPLPVSAIEYGQQKYGDHRDRTGRQKSSGRFQQLVLGALPHRQDEVLTVRVQFDARRREMHNPVIGCHKRVTEELVVEAQPQSGWKGDTQSEGWESAAPRFSGE
ncbi:MAG: hypothetical protein K8R59_01915 [Thermoanaerobaculales bacterium]|nr:hypothetical protein [Thermoanaerobaculales bacterium]